MHSNLSDEEKVRYKRQLSLKGFGVDAQLKLKNASVLVVGAGGLGSPVLLYIAAAGVGKIGIVDGDLVSISNLQRQVLYRMEDVGKNKSEKAKRTLIERNPLVSIHTYPFYCDATNCLSILKEYDLIIDTSDNFQTRYLLNDACILLDKTLVYAALFGYEGQISVFNYRQGPTLRCLFPEIPKKGLIDNCNESGVLGVLPGLIGAWQAQEAIKVITGIGEVLSGKLLIFNELNNELRTIGFSLNPDNRVVHDLEHFTKKEGNHPEEFEISSRKLREWLKEETIQMIDVRGQDEFIESNIGGINIPLSGLEQQLDKIDQTQKIVIICQSGLRSEMGYEIITKAFPYAKVYHLKGGLNDYLL